MPWQVNGTFLRVNTDFSGPTVWQQDQQASIKIIASRHDDHDEDLALGIQACLNINGLNAMLANLDMGGFKIINMAPGTADDDNALLGQTLAYPSAGSFDDPSRELRLLRQDGNGYDVIIIPGAGGGGGGTVTQVNTGIGLTGGPINVSGTIDLDAIGSPGQTYSGGIGSITIDDYGRVTQVVESTTSSMNLGHNRSASNITITSSTGNNTTIANATGSENGWMDPTSWSRVNNPAAGNVYGITLTIDADDIKWNVTGSSALAVSVPLWYAQTDQPGLFSGEVTTDDTPSGAGKPDGYVFLVVDP